MAAPILATKLYLPSPRPRIVPRPRLIERLNEGLQRAPGVTLISASAGFGKTTLVSEWIAGCQQPVAWFSLDEGDNDLTRFLTYLVAALQTIAPQMGEGLLAALQSPQPPSGEALLTTLLNEITAIPHPFILVLDDYHTIDSKPVGEALTFLLKHLPPHMHLVIATREDPPLPLSRLRARGQLTELRAADLRFSPAEAAQFLNQGMGLNLSAADVAALEARTEGWIAGLQLAALSMQGLQDTAGFIKSFTGSHHFVLDYLIEEVLQQQSPGIQAFLLRTSILDRLCGPLCDAVLGSPSPCGQDTLEYLERANLFIIPLDNERRWYRYHHLFADLLRQRLGQSAYSGIEKEGVPAYHIHASQWYEENGLVLEAFQHAAAANDIDRAWRLVEGGGMPLHLRGVANTILAWLASLPTAVLDARPFLRVRSATLALMAGQTTGVEEQLQAAERVLQNSALDDKGRDLLGQIACARATLALTRYDPETMLIQARCALEYLLPDNLPFLFTANWALASAYLIKGDRSAAARACQEVLSISQKSGDVFSIILATTNLAQVQEMENQLFLAAETYRSILPLFGEYPQPNAERTLLGLARICYEWNDLDAAEQYGQQSLQLARQYDRVIDRYILGEVFLARLKLARADVDGAAAQLAQAEQSARLQKFILRLPDIAAVQVLVLLRQGRLAAAAQLAQQVELPLSHALVLLAQGEPSASLSLLEPLRQQMEARHWPDECLKVMVLQAVALHAHGEKENAVQALAGALALAEPGGYIRLFVDAGAPMAQLLHEAAARGVMPDYTARLLAAFEAEPRKNEAQPDLPPAPPALQQGHPACAPLIEPLSQRELEVLRLLAQGLSNHQISERLFLALDTIKGHNRRIFEKLQVQRRTEAVVRARELGLL